MPYDFHDLVVGGEFRGIGGPTKVIEVIGLVMSVATQIRDEKNQGSILGE